MSNRDRDLGSEFAAQDLGAGDVKDVPALAATADGGTVEDAMSKLAAATGIADPAALKLIVEAATASLNASHKAEVDALRSEIDAVRQEGREGRVVDYNESAGGYPWMYYRKPAAWPDVQTRNWITMGPGGAGKDGHRDNGSFVLYVKKGFIPLTKYGQCPVPVSNKVSDTYSEFIKKGGAKEFPASQIVAYQWHRNNPFIRQGVRWEQLDGIIDKLKSWTCEYCGFRLDFMPDDPMVGQAYMIHLRVTDKVDFREASEAVKRQNLTATPFAQRSIEEIASLSRP